MIVATTGARNLAFACAAACVCLLTGGIAPAKESTWYRFENSHFEAYSDESERTVRKLLDDLERFRAAVLQVANIREPQGVPKAQVVIFGSEKEFQDLIDSTRIGGFATSIGGVPYMVLAAGRDVKFTEMAIRHEFAHILLAYKNFAYPRWFNEGFAELMSATSFRDKNTKFTVGEHPGRRQAESIATPWSQLIGESFDPHSFQSAGKASDAYLRSWLLTHYFMLGNNFGNTDELAQYLTLVANGQPSLAAFETVVGEPADVFGSKFFRQYRRNAKYVTYTFRPQSLDHDFRRTEVPIEEIRPIIEPFRR